MNRRCDSCHEVLTVDENGFFVGPDGTSDCPMSDEGHTHHGKKSL